MSSDNNNSRPELGETFTEKIEGSTDSYPGTTGGKISFPDELKEGGDG